MLSVQLVEHLACEESPLLLNSHGSMNTCRPACQRKYWMLYRSLQVPCPAVRPSLILLLSQGKTTPLHIPFTVIPTEKKLGCIDQTGTGTLIWIMMGCRNTYLQSGL